MDNKRKYKPSMHNFNVAFPKGIYTIRLHKVAISSCIYQKYKKEITYLQFIYSLDDITRKHLIWYGRIERMDPTRLPKIMIHWKPEGRKKRGRPRKIWKDGIYTVMNERDLRMGECNNRRQWNIKVGRRRQTF